VKKMGLNFTSSQIKMFIEQSKWAEPYSENEELVLDDRRLLIEDCKGAATRAKRILDAYFKEHPDDKIENYL
jgi:hypothetical protein